MYLMCLWMVETISPCHVVLQIMLFIIYFRSAAFSTCSHVNVFFVSLMVNKPFKHCGTDSYNWNSLC